MALSEGLAVARAAANQDRKKSLGQRIWDAKWCYVFLLPGLVLAGMFTFYPTVMSWYISFLDWSGLGVKPRWIGLSNFIEAVQDPLFWSSFGRSFAFAAMEVPVELTLGFVAALVLNDASLRLRPLFRTLFFLPVVTIGAIVGVVMTLMLNPFDGPVNAALSALHITSRPIDFLGNPDTAMFAVVGVAVWKGMGMTMIYWLVALQTVPNELYEAARVDGASKSRMHLSITVPLIIPFAIIILLMNFVSALRSFALIQTMTQGGPGFSTELIEVYIYRLAFAPDYTPRLGYASAVAVFFGVTVLILTLIQFAAIRRAAALRQQGGKRA